MDERQLRAFAEHESRPTNMDIRRAKEAILDYFAEQGEGCVVQGDTIISFVQRRLVPDNPSPTPGPIPDGYLSVSPDLYRFKMERAVREAIQMLHSTGVLISYGPIELDTSEPHRPREQRFLFSRGQSQEPATLPFLSLYFSYSLSTPFAGKQFRLGNADVYMSSLLRQHLSSRVQRCLRECIDAFRHGLFLSACMNAGAASESLWMDLGRTLAGKKVASKKLTDEFDESKKGPRNTSGIIEEAWKVLIYECRDLLREVIGGQTEMDIFKNRTDTFRHLRNYAMHDDDADVDEPRFTYDETGLLLLNAADYFNKLVQLRLEIDKLDDRP